VRGRAWTALWGVTVAAGTLHGQEIKAPQEKWTLQFEPTAWYTAPGGRVKLPGSAPGVLGAPLGDINLDSARIAPGGELHLYDGRWRITVGGFRLEQDDRGSTAAFAGQVGPVSFSPGDSIKASMDLTSVEATVAYRLDIPDWMAGKPGSNYAGQFDVLGGVRLYDLSFGFTAPSGTTKEDETQAHPLIGAKWSMDVVQQFTIDVQIDLGGFTYGGDTFTYGYSINAGFIWRPQENVGVQVGYRDLAFELRSGPAGDRFEYRGALQGLYAGVVIRF
jgi:hypothetical protein